MKKKLLFVIPSLRSGGAEKSLVSLLQTLDPDKFYVDLFLFRRDGLFLPLIPDYVNIIDGGETYKYFDGPAKDAALYFLKKGKLSMAIRRIIYGKKQSAAPKERSEKLWRQLSHALPRLSGYDAAIAYLEGNATYFVTDKVQAEKKIAFLHIDYDKIAVQHSADLKAYKKIDTLISVSDLCTQKAEKHFPFLKDRTVTMHNIISEKLIRKMAQEPCDIPSDVPALLTVARFSPQKGLDIAVKACALLKKRGVKFRWYHIGTGVLYNEILAQIKQEGAAEDFVLLGERSNPYPYMKACDIYVQPSRYEGKSIAIDEVKVLAKPIVVTNFGTVYDQITDGVNGLIVDMTPQGVADGIEKMLSDPDLRAKLRENLTKEKIGNEEEIEKLTAVL